MDNFKYYAIFGGFGPQNWMNALIPDIYGKCDGLTVCSVDSVTGEMEKVYTTHGTVSPSTLVLNKNCTRIYTTNECHDFRERGWGGGITSFKFDKKTGKVEFLNDSLAFGSSSAYITLDKTGRYAFVANHGTKFYCSRFEKYKDSYRPVVIRDEGVVTVFRIKKDGSVGKCVDRFILHGTGADTFEHASAHPHSIIIDDQDYAVIPNKGGDSITLAHFNRETEKLEILSVLKRGLGSSPRHAVFVNGTDFVLIQNEYNGYLGSYRINRKEGSLGDISYLDTVDPDYQAEGNLLGMKTNHPWGCDVQIHPSNRFVYTNNSQPGITMFLLDEKTGKLEVGKYYHFIKGWMRGMQITPDGRFLCVTGVMNEKAYMFHIDQTTGELTPASEIELPTPTAVRFVMR